MTNPLTTNPTMTCDVLKLTCTIKRGEQPNTFIGRIIEIPGIVAQGASEDEVYESLQESARLMVDVYRRKEALALLKAQNTNPVQVEEEEQLCFELESVEG